MDSITIQNLIVYGYHGCTDEEKAKGQDFAITIKMFADLSNAGSTDELSKTINYANVCELVKKEFTAKKYNTLEKCATVLADSILKVFTKIKTVNVSVKKAQAVMNAQFDFVGVDIERSNAVVYLGLGSNSGVREYNIQRAIKDIGEFGEITTVSNFYSTKPEGGVVQADFINCCVELNTAIPPNQLLSIIKEIELKIGRTKSVNWGPRIIDIDLLLYDNKVLESSMLVVPHPLMHTRQFVLTPLLEIAQNVLHPVFHKTISQLKNELDKKDLEQNSKQQNPSNLHLSQQTSHMSQQNTVSVMPQQIQSSSSPMQSFQNPIFNSPSQMLPQPISQRQTEFKNDVNVQFQNNYNQQQGFSNNRQFGQSIFSNSQPLYPLQNNKSTQDNIFKSNTSLNNFSSTPLSSASKVSIGENKYKSSLGDLFSGDTYSNVNNNSVQKQSQDSGYYQKTPITFDEPKLSNNFSQSNSFPVRKTIDEVAYNNNSYKNDTNRERENIDLNTSIPTFNSKPLKKQEKNNDAFGYGMLPIDSFDDD